MGLPIDIHSMRLFVRLLLGLILLSVAISKLVHRSEFRKGIEDYRIIPQMLNSKLALATVFSFCIPIAELVAGLGPISGLLLVPAIILAIALFVIFSGAILFNLVQGRTDLSCHCGGALGEHRISWWLIVRNTFFVVCSFFLVFTPSDPFTIDTLIRRSSSLNTAIWVGTALPIALLVLGVLLVFVLLNAVRVVLRPQ